MSFRGYKYDGAVTAFGKVIASKWSGRTVAETEKRAKANLMYQFKKQNGLAPSAKIEFSGKVKEVED